MVGGSTLLLNRSGFLHADTPPTSPRTFTKQQLAMHSSTSKGIFVAFGDGVYDITEFIKLHPGGSEKARIYSAYMTLSIDNASCWKTCRTVLGKLRVPP
jgi:predicted heme/steroid binding protein